jgi:hypothetical protein
LCHASILPGDGLVVAVDLRVSALRALGQVVQGLGACVGLAGVYRQNQCGSFGTRCHCEFPLWVVRSVNDAPGLRARATFMLYRLELDAVALGGVAASQSMRSAEQLRIAVVGRDEAEAAFVKPPG